MNTDRSSTLGSNIGVLVLDLLALPLVYVLATERKLIIPIIMPLLAYIIFGIRSLLAFGIPARGRRDPLPEELAQWATDAGFRVKTAELVGKGVKAVYVSARKEGDRT